MIGAAQVLASGSVLSPSHLIASYGAIGVGLILFAETGLLVGIVLPGDSLLFLAGAYAHSRDPGHPHPAIGALLVLAAIGAVLGGQTGYLIGRRIGPALFARKDSRFFKRAYVERTEEYFARFGPRTIVMARFIPVVRTLSSPAAGIGRMPLPVFAAYNAVGGILWSCGVLMLGYLIGGAVNIDRYIIPITVVIVVVSFVPVVIEARRARRT